MTCGVYQILNTINGWRYIGSSKSIEDRWRHHKRDLHNMDHANPRLQKDWLELGPDSFSFIVLKETPIATRFEVEQSYLPVECTITALRSNKFYNIRPIVGTYLKRITKDLNLADNDATTLKELLELRNYNLQRRQLIKEEEARKRAIYQAQVQAKQEFMENLIADLVLRHLKPKLADFKSDPNYTPFTYQDLKDMGILFKAGLRNSLEDRYQEAFNSATKDKGENWALFRDLDSYTMNWAAIFDAIENMF